MEWSREDWEILLKARHCDGKATYSEVKNAFAARARLDSLGMMTPVSSKDDVIVVKIEEDKVAKGLADGLSDDCMTAVSGLDWATLVQNDPCFIDTSRFPEAFEWQDHEITPECRRLSLPTRLEVQRMVDQALKEGKAEDQYDQAERLVVVGKVTKSMCMIIGGAEGMYKREYRRRLEKEAKVKLLEVWLERQGVGVDGSELLADPGKMPCGFSRAESASRGTEV